MVQVIDVLLIILCRIWKFQIKKVFTFLLLTEYTSDNFMDKYSLKVSYHGNTFLIHEMLVLVSLITIIDEI